MSLFIKCTLRWQIWTNKKLLLVLLHCEVMANFWRQFDKQIAVSTQIVSVYIHVPSFNNRQLREADENFSTLSYNDDMQSYTYTNLLLRIPPLFPFSLGKELVSPFSFFFSAQIQICSNIYMVITTKSEKCKCMCFQRVIAVSACFCYMVVVCRNA